MNRDAIKQLESSDIEKRINAVEIIAKGVDPEDVDPLLDHLDREEEQSVRERIILALELLMPARGFVSIERMLRSHDAFMRNAGVELLKKQDDTILERLAELARDDDKDVRKLAIDAAAAYQGSRVVDIMKERLSDSDINVVCTALEHLGSMKAVDAAHETDLLLLGSDNHLLQCTALEALASIGNTDHLEKIKEKFKDNPDPLLRYSFIKFLGRCAGYEFFSEYISRLDDSELVAYSREIIDSTEMIMKRFPDAINYGRLQKTLMRLSGKIDEGPARYEVLGLIVRFSGSKMLKQARHDIMSDDMMTVLAALEILGEYGEENDLELVEGVMERFEEETMEEAVADASGRIAERCAKR